MTIVVINNNSNNNRICIFLPLSLFNMLLIWSIYIYQSNMGVLKFTMNTITLLYKPLLVNLDYSKWNIENIIFSIKLCYVQNLNTY